MSTQKNEHNPEPELKPCPYCGGTARLFSQFVKQDTMTKKPLYLAMVACDNEGSCAANVGSVIQDEEDARAIAVEHWNRRITPPTDTPGSGREGETVEVESKTFIAGHQDWEGECVTAEFARTLETELAELRQAADGLLASIEEQPHHISCRYIPPLHRTAIEDCSGLYECNCWKSKALARYRTASNPSNSPTASRESQG